MNHLAVIQTEFLKEARHWDDLTRDEQRAYLKRHPASKRRLTAGPKVGDPGEKKEKRPKHGPDSKEHEDAKNKKIKEMKQKFITSHVFKEGQKVRLKPNKSEGFKEEFGKIESVDDVSHGVITVTVDKKYRDGPEDDGLREVTPDQIEAQNESTEDIDAQIEALQKKKQELADQSKQKDIESAPKPKKSQVFDFFENMVSHIWKDEDVDKQKKILERHFPKSKKLIDKIVDVAGEASNDRSDAESTSESAEHELFERDFSKNFGKMEKLINKLFSKK
jgi:hypothetical protein